jgi:hypothetical protein
LTSTAIRPSGRVVKVTGALSTLITLSFAAQ